MAFYSRLLVVLYAVAALNAIYVFMASGMYDKNQLASEILIRIMWILLRVALFITILRIGHLFDLKLQTQVLKSGRICVLGIKTEKEVLRVKIPRTRPVSECFGLGDSEY